MSTERLDTIERSPLSLLPQRSPLVTFLQGGSRNSLQCGSMSASPSPLQNHILEALPPAVQDRLFPHLKLVALPLAAVVYESGAPLRDIYFPTDCIISLLYVLENGASAEISVVGNEGAVGVSLFIGGETTSSRAVVQSGGSAYRLAGSRLKAEFERHGDMLHILLRYTQSLLTQMAQTAVCNRHHSVDQQLCRWLLLSLDRLPSNKLSGTQRADRQHARCAPRRRHRRRRQASEVRRHRVRARPDYRPGPPAARAALLRVLRGGEEGNRPRSARQSVAPRRGKPKRGKITRRRLRRALFASAPTLPSRSGRLPASKNATPRPLRRYHGPSPRFTVDLLGPTARSFIMSPIKAFTALVATTFLLTVLGCAATRTREGTGQYVDDSVITTKVKSAILSEPGLNVSEINVETFKGTVQLSGFVSTRNDVDHAIRVARAVGGVKSVTNDMQVK